MNAIGNSLAVGGRRVGGLAAGLVLLAASFAWAAQLIGTDRIPEAMTTDLEFTANKMVSENQVVQALPYLEELASRFEATKGAKFEQKLERVYFFQGVGQMQVGNYHEAADVFEKYAARFSDATDAPVAIEFLGDAQRLIDDYASAAKTYGILRRNRKLSSEVLVDVLVKEADCRVRLAHWEEAIPLLREVISRAPSPSIQGEAAAALVQAYLALDKVDEVVRMLPLLMSVSAARYDIGFNLLLIESGDTKFHAEDYPNALLLYQLALTREELVAWHEMEIAEIEAALASYTGTRQFKRILELRERLARLKKQLKDLLGQESYTQELLLRKAQTYVRMDRRWEAMWGYWEVWKRFPKSDLARSSLYGAFALAGELGMDDLAIEWGNAFLDQFGPGEFFDEASLQLVQLHVRRMEFENALAVSRKARRLNPKHTLTDRLLFLEGYSLLQLERFDEAIQTLTKLRVEHPQSVSVEGADYWIGMANLFKPDYSAARDEFSEFLAKYIGGAYYEDAFFRLGVTFYGLLKFDEADRQLRDFMAKFPASPLRAEALSFLGDIAAAEGRLDDALAFYREVPTRTEIMAQIDHAVFQIGKILELQSDFAAMADHFQDYLNRYRTQGRYTEAIWRVGFAKKQLGDIAGMLKVFESSFKRFGNDRTAVGIDLILGEWPHQYASYYDKPPVELLSEELRRATDRRDQTLRLRMLWSLAQLGETNAAPLSFSDADIEAASPAVLLWMAGTRTDDGVFARKAYERVLSEYADTQWAEQSLMRLAEVEAAKGNRIRAMDLFRRVRESYPGSPVAGMAMKREADLLRERRQFTEAVDLYLQILEVKEWRGELWAESLYRVGESLMLKGDLREAFAYFQRVYVLYMGYPQWAAQAYLQSAICLEKLNRRQEAVDTLTEMLRLPALQGDPALDEARKRLEALK